MPGMESISEANVPGHCAVGEILQDGQLLIFFDTHHLRTPYLRREFSYTEHHSAQLYSQMGQRWDQLVRKLQQRIFSIYKTDFYCLFTNLENYAEN